MFLMNSCCSCVVVLGLISSVLGKRLNDLFLYRVGRETLIQSVSNVCFCSVKIFHVICVLVCATQENYEVPWLYRKGIVRSFCFSVISF